MLTPHDTCVSIIHRWLRDQKEFEMKNELRLVETRKENGTFLATVYVEDFIVHAKGIKFTGNFTVTDSRKIFDENGVELSLEKMEVEELAKMIGYKTYEMYRADRRMLQFTTKIDDWYEIWDRFTDFNFSD